MNQLSLNPVGRNVIDLTVRRQATSNVRPFAASRARARASLRPARSSAIGGATRRTGRCSASGLFPKARVSPPRPFPCGVPVEGDPR